MHRRKCIHEEKTLTQLDRQDSLALRQLEGQYQASSTTPNQSKPHQIQQLIPHAKRHRSQVLRGGDG